MLDSTDREFIRKEIKKVINSQQPEQKDKQTKVKESKSNNKESLKTLADVAKSVKSSSLGKGAMNAFLYSNPVTAALANNFDLISGIGKGVGKLTSATIKALKQNKPNNKKEQQPNTNNKLIKTNIGTKQLPQQVQRVMSTNCTNYIMAKNAMFVGGKNYISINMPGNRYGMFTTNEKSSNTQDVITNTVTKKLSSKNVKQIPVNKKLNLPDGPVIDAKFTSTSTKINKAQLAEMKTTNKLLTVMNKRTMLIVGGVLLGVGAIAALAAFLYNKFNIAKNSTKPTYSTSQINSFKQQSINTPDNTSIKINEGIQNEIKPTNVKQFNKIAEVGGKSIDTGLVSGYTAKSKEGSVYRAPFDMKIKSFKENNRKLGVINIIAEKRSTGIDKDIEIMNITNPVVYPEQIVKKNQPIGLIGPGGDIHIKDISKQDFDSYIQDIGNLAESEDKQKFNITEQDQQQINGYFETLATHKKMNPDKPAQVSSTDKKYLEQQNNIKENRNKQAIQTLQTAIDKGYNGTSLYGRWVPKDQLEIELNKYKADYNKTNKNAEIGTSQSVKASPNKENKTTIQEQPKQQKPNNISISQGTNRTKCYGLSYPMDIAAANCDIFTV